MHMRRILLAFSLSVSAASVAFADLVNLNQENGSTDRIEQLTRTLAQGAYTHPDDIDIPAQTKLNVQLREKPVELNNRTLAQKYAN
ncbi:M23 family peptidase, partial [Salmonella enterica subsp. enterica]|nr:M23 family peptidase [Salmonella enterica subsp. enterica]MIP96659.1 M23 family peptidase [Salmonella enterica subsp. enterica]